ncbi:Cyclic nucleotide-binding protein [Pseudocohnilembus persalinus]|uniref:Cyclic nucleotide-binding protein n=1 Tax=Pseudocohnilembus persalinus TaxID=266149 RepID=A0A0V0R064_PSEPJ|nr:Cyclic nucleotide-binding protein [Pseudocohnilembus persalinus]|eukprot:KRX07951.1 Cyclic nucleotide-binding protein [Pseudocohnilembus persalinus]
MEKNGFQRASLFDKNKHIQLLKLNNQDEDTIYEGEMNSSQILHIKTLNCENDEQKYQRNLQQQQVENKEFLKIQDQQDFKDFQDIKQTLSSRELDIKLQQNSELFQKQKILEDFNIRNEDQLKLENDENYQNKVVKFQEGNFQSETLNGLNRNTDKSLTFKQNELNQQKMMSQIFAYVLENISQTIKKLTKNSAEYKQNLETLNIFMKNKSLDNETQTKVRQQLEHSYKATKQLNINQQARQVLEQLPNSLSAQITNQINGALVKKFKPLCKNFSEKTLEMVYKNDNILSEVSYVAQEIILNQNEQQDIFLYYIVAGKVELFIQDQQSQDENKQLHVFQELKEGDFFCLNNFFTGQTPKFSARSTVYSNICQIKRSGFLNVLKQNPQEHEKFHHIKDQILYNGITKYFKKQCLVCKNLGHSEEDCGLLVYNPKRYRLALKNSYNNKSVQVRQKYLRGYKKNDIIYAYQMIENNVILNEHFKQKYPNLYLNYDEQTCNSNLEDNYEYSDDNIQQEQEVNFNDDFTINNNLNLIKINSKIANLVNQSQASIQDFQFKNQNLLQKINSHHSNINFNLNKQNSKIKSQEIQSFNDSEQIKDKQISDLEEQSQENCSQFENNKKDYLGLNQNLYLQMNLIKSIQQLISEQIKQQTFILRRKKQNKQNQNISLQMQQHQQHQGKKLQSILKKREVFIQDRHPDDQFQESITFEFDGNQKNQQYQYLQLFESLNETLDEKEKEFNQREQDFENQLYNQGSANIQVMTQQQYAQNQKLFGHNNSDSNDYQQQQQDMQQEQQEQLKQEQQKQEEQEENNRQQQKLKQQMEKEKEKEREKQQKEKQRQKEIQQQQQKKEEQTQQMQQKQQQQEQIKAKQPQNQQQNQNSNSNYQQQQQQNQKNQQSENNGNEQKKQIPQQQQQSTQQQQLQQQQSQQQQNNGHYNQQQQQQQQQNSISSTQKKKKMTPQQIQQQQQYCQSLQRDQTLGYYIKMMKLSNETQAKSADYFPSSLMKEKISIKSHFPKHRMLNEKNTYEQYLAAKELKIREWRFHTKFSTWFKRMENPKQQNKDLEIGNYIFFDFEKAWQQRKKTEFQFKYQYYEREEL